MRNTLPITITFALLGFCLPGRSTTVDCSTLTNMSQLIATDPGGGCTAVFAGTTFTFSDWAASGTSTGTGITPLTSQVTFLLENPGTSAFGSVYGFEFNPDLNVVGTGSEDLFISYTITASASVITSLHVSETSVTSGPLSDATVSEGPDIGCTGISVGCSVQPSITVTAADPTAQLLGLGPYEQVYVSKDIGVYDNSIGWGWAPSSASTSGVLDAIDIQNRNGTSDAPEPGSLVLTGAGLIGLVSWTKRRRVNRAAKRT